MRRARRVLVVNPNTTDAVTQAFVGVARAFGHAGVGFEPVTGRFGAQIVTTEAENIIAGHAALDLVAHHLAGHDAVILAISFDTGLAALRGLLPVPVIGITEAALRAAIGDGRRVGAVFFGEVSRALYTALFRSYGADLVGSKAVDITSTADYLDPMAKDAAVIAACNSLAANGAEAVVICGAAIVGMAARVQDRAPVPLFDGAEAVAACLRALDTGAARPQPTAVPVGGSIGLSPALAAFLRGTAGQ